MIFKVRNVKFGESMPGEIIRGGALAIHADNYKSTHLEVIANVSHQLFYIKDNKNKKMFFVPIQGNTIFGEIQETISDNEFNDFMGFKEKPEVKLSDIMTMRLPPEIIKKRRGRPPIYKSSSLTS